MKALKKFIQSNLFVISIYSTLIFICYFLIPWIKEGTVYFFRSDEAAYLYIYKQITMSGFIPTELNYIGGIPNYIYPTLYLLLSILLTTANQTFNLLMGSISLQLILFFILTFSSLIIFKLVRLLSKQFVMPFFAGLFYIILPVISYRLFYSHATFYANFVGIFFLLLFLYYLTKYRFESQKKNLVLSIIFYSITLFTHQLVFLMSTIILGMDFFLRIFQKKNVFYELIEKAIFVISALILNLGYLIKTPLAQKALSILGIAHYEQFGREVVIKQSADALPTLIPDIVLVVSIISVLFIFLNKSYKSFYLIALFHVFIITSILLNYVDIHFPASFRYDTFYIVTLPIILSCFLNFFKKTKIKIFLLVFIVYLFSLGTSNVVNGFSPSEMHSLDVALNTLSCKNTVSYFRIAPWVPVLSNSSIYYAHVDIYNAHQDKMDEEMDMLSYQKELKDRLSLIKEKKVDCIIYEKNILVVDDIKVKGWEEWKYKNLYGVSSKHYEDNNLVVFKFNY